MGYCEHDADCSGVGWAHDAALTLEQRNELGLPEGEQSMAHAKRLMRSYRKGDGAQASSRESSRVLLYRRCR
jgi:hypothetical protein